MEFNIANVVKLLSLHFPSESANADFSNIEMEVAEYIKDVLYDLQQENDDLVQLPGDDCEETHTKENDPDFQVVSDKSVAHERFTYPRETMTKIVEMKASGVPLSTIQKNYKMVTDAKQITRFDTYLHGSTRLAEDE
ncbi:hypothetical protein QR680_009431 [Steinernema hermaphroditum]|uniref:Uncharacterized protein n=1 Tax=Steinernema hermaphroditum TaxID=289476 RepID=A0AA39IMM4_9BILA|nr:hypothetical protein QR680_009431 [Steinernema hermaphroditum]